MKRYLIVGHYLYGTSTLDEIGKTDLVERKNKDTDHLFDLKNGTEFDPEKTSGCR